MVICKKQRLIENRNIKLIAYTNYEKLNLENKKIPIDDETFTIHGATWDTATVNVKVSGRGNYVLARLKLLKPYWSKSALVKEVLEKALLEMEKDIDRKI